MVTPMIQAWVFVQNWLANVGRDESGQGLTEYALIIALVAILVIGAILLMTGSLKGVFGHVTTCLNNASSGTSTSC